mmetsp:Transcript_1375/g.1855  ORF Transcript_1375/g.1855 Transcript_1375/m.1855 type:complete len:531 (+) Transcript_1375:91-1683(+)
MMLRFSPFSVVVVVVVFTTLGVHAEQSTKLPPSTSTSATIPQKCLTMDNMFAGLKEMEYAVRGKVVIAADEIHADLKKAENKDKYPFDHIVYTNIGNPHSVGQKPLTWPRQVMALVDLPDEMGVDHPLAEKMFPIDAIARAKEIKQALEGSGTGAYTHSKGVKAFREDVAKFIETRDGGNIAADPESIFLTNGASAGITMILTALIAHNKCGIMIPIPQYPLYSATIDLLQGQKVGYYLEEENGWSLNVKELERAYEDAKRKGIDIRGLVAINPGNPSGAVLTRENLHDVVNFCSKHNIVLLADEVYQENVYEDNAEFISCKRAAHEMGLLEPDNNKIELVSFHSTSKGVFGECGRRGGYMELVGFTTDVKDTLYKMASAFLCGSTNGQVMTSLMVRGPAPTDVSYQKHEREIQKIFESLKSRSVMVSEGLNAISGFSCQPATGSMYCFPSIEMPKAAIAAANAMGTPPDTLYAVSLLKRTGICVVPGSGFGQKEGRFGFRTTFLPTETEMVKAVERIRQHYEEFCEEYK